jgi:beta-alanine degradation protein BauB
MTNDRISSQREVALESTPTHAAASGGVTRRDVLALLAAFGVPSTALAQDPVKIMPKNYRVAFENDMVRVLEYNNRPGMGPCGVGLHYHPRHVDIFLTSYRGQVTEDGKIRVGQAKAGDVEWAEAGTHAVENIDKTASRMFIVEIKDANWKPSTG